MRLLLVILALSALFSVSCSDTSNVTANTDPTPTPTPTRTPTKEEKERDAAETKELQDAALRQFIDQEHKGWVLSGIGPDFCQVDDTVPCDLHLTKGKENKVIPVLMRRFERPDGTHYWLVFAARPSDLLQGKLDLIKERAADEAKRSTLENLTFDQCRDVFDDGRDYEPPEDYDPWT